MADGDDAVGAELAEIAATLNAAWAGQRAAVEALRVETPEQAKLEELRRLGAEARARADSGSVDERLTSLWQAGAAETVAAAIAELIAFADAESRIADQWQRLAKGVETYVAMRQALVVAVREGAGAHRQTRALQLRLTRLGDTLRAQGIAVPREVVVVPTVEGAAQDGEAAP